MDNVTARDYLYTYPNINRIVIQHHPKPKFGFTEDNIYRILEKELGKLIALVAAVDDCGNIDDVDGKNWFDLREELL